VNSASSFCSRRNRLLAPGFAFFATACLRADCACTVRRVLSADRGVLPKGEFCTVSLADGARPATRAARDFFPCKRRFTAHSSSVVDGCMWSIATFIEAGNRCAASSKRAAILQNAILRARTSTADMSNRLRSRAARPTYDAIGGGDIAGGANDLGQISTRRVARLVPYATPNPRLYLCSSSTPPGAGVHGLCEFFAARAALTRLQRRASD
jgi:hypothetical protein